MRDTNTDPSTKGKLRLTSCACAFLGVLTTLGIGFGVSTCISALSPSPTIAASSTQQVDLSDPNIRVTYATDGTMYVDVYVHNDNTSDVNVNVNDPNKKPLDEGGDYKDDENQGSTESGNNQNHHDGCKCEDCTKNDTEDTKPNDTDDNTGNIDDDNTGNTDDGNTDDGNTNKPGDDANVDKPDNEQSQGSDEEIDNDDTKPSGDDVVYDIVWGDTLSKISNMTGYSVDFLAEYNHISNPNLIYAGSTIRYPKKQ